MATPSAIFTEMVSTTLRNVDKDVTDNVSANNALLNRLKKKNNFKTFGGGNEIQIPLEYAENDTYLRYNGFQTQNVDASDVITSAKYDWCQISLHVVSSGRELRMNSGKEAMINLVQSKKKNALNTAANNFSTDIYSDGSLPNQIGGLANIIQTNGQGTVGGIDSATFEFWQNQYLEITGTNAYTKDTFKQYMNQLWLRQVRGKDKPDLIVMSHDFYSTFEAGEQQNQRYMNAEMADAGFVTIKYKTADVIFDDNANFTTTAEKAYFVNTDYFYIFQHKDAQWTADDAKRPVNQDAVVLPFYWMGNACTSNRSLQGVLLDAS